MSKIALRAYTREIESLIDQGHQEEAVAHCQHILKTYPKHLETYRMLGKAYLELHRYPDAIDIFQRVLTSVPDDFVSHLGMSIAYDEQKNLDQAVWHMERAFEANPSNGGVQAELRRLYGRRDGLEPPKIQLTRGALAKMYIRGAQYAQAIQEIKTVLHEDPERLDLKVLMAQAHFRAGQRVEATEICNQILQVSPYCLEANRILVEILPGTSLASSVDVYRKRLQQLDPYMGLVTGSTYDVAGVADNAVSIERLEWDPTAAPALPVWEPEPASEQPAAPPAAESAIPDWMQAQGWGPSTGEFQEGPLSFDEPESSSEPAQEISPSEMPDWLKAMAHPGTGELKSQPEEKTDEADLDWLSGLGAAAGATGLAGLGAESAPAAEQPAAADDTPDWLAGLGAESAPAAGQPAAPAENIPDWLAGVGLAGIAAASQSAPEREAEQEPISGVVAGPGTSADEQDEAFKWLESLAAGQGAKPEELLTKPEERLDSAPGWVSSVEETPAIPAAEIPTEFVPEPPVEIEAEPLAPELSAPVAGPGTSSDEQDEAFKWLESLAAGQGAKPEELLTKPEERAEQAPGWVGQVENPPPALSAPVSAGPGISADDQDEAFKWLESLAAGQGAKPEELLTKPEERLEAAPEWVNAVEQAPAPAGESELPDWMAAAQEPEPPAAPAWMAEPESSTETSQPEPGLTEPVMDWFATESQPRPAEQPVISAAPEQADISEWLKSLDEESQAAPAAPGGPILEEELPDWLKDETADTVPPQPVPVSGWVPAVEPPKTPQPEPPKVSQPPVETTRQAPAAPVPQAHQPSAGIVSPVAAQAQTPPPPAAAPVPQTPRIPPQVPAQPPVSPEVPVARPAVRQTGMLGGDKDAMLLHRARLLLEKANLTTAMSEYARLIKKGKYMDEIIHDLQEATYTHPVDVIVWQTLGDAYMRNNRLQEALDAYTKAEELLR